MKTPLQTIVLGKKFTNPLVLASGILGVTGASMAHVVAHGAGGVTMKSVTGEPITGNPSPVMLAEKEFMLNAVGLPGPGVDAAIPELHQFKKLSSGKLIGSIFGRTIEEFGAVTEKICQAPIDLLEIDISCPHASHLYKTPFAHDIASIEKITKIVKKYSTVPITVKLSPNTWHIGDFAKAAESAGADGITAVNTAVGMVINAQARMPVLANKAGGVSGPALKPIAIKAVYDVYEAVDIPIIGTGGITTGLDAIEMLMAGASLIGVGSAFYYRGPEVMSLIAEEMEAFMKAEGFSSVKDLVGIAHH